MDDREQTAKKLLKEAIFGTNNTQKLKVYVQICKYIHELNTELETIYHGITIARRYLSEELDKKDEMIDKLIKEIKGE